MRNPHYKAEMRRMRELRLKSLDEPMTEKDNSRLWMSMAYSRVGIEFDCIHAVGLWNLNSAVQSICGSHTRLLKYIKNRYCT